MQRFLAVSTQLTGARAQALVALAIGLAAIIIGWLARHSGKRAGAIAALVVATIGVVLGAVRLATAGPLGSGGGKLGAIVAIVVSLIGARLGWSALRRSR